MFRSKSKEDNTHEAKLLITKLNQEKRERQKFQMLQLEKQKLRLQKQLQRQAEHERIKQNEMRHSIIEKLDEMSRKRSEEREKREEIEKNWKIKKREIDNTTYLHEKLERQSSRKVRLIINYSVTILGFTQREHKIIKR